LVFSSSSFCKSIFWKACQTTFSYRSWRIVGGFSIFQRHWTRKVSAFGWYASRCVLKWIIFMIFLNRVVFQSTFLPWN
jgi:hypothetical protein